MIKIIIPVVIKSLLDPEDILYFFQGEQFSYVRPLAEPGAMEEMRNKKSQTGLCPIPAGGETLRSQRRR